MKLIIAILLCMFFSNTYALELTFDANACDTNDKATKQSKIMVTNEQGSFYAIRATGGYPYSSFPYGTPCIETSFGGADVDKNTGSVSGHALFVDPYLYVFLPAKYDYVIASNGKLVPVPLYNVENMFKFVKNEQGFLLLTQIELANNKLYFERYAAEAVIYKLNMDSTKPQ